MNLQKITDFYPWVESANDSLLGQFTFCLDRNSGSGEFAFVYLLLKLLKHGTKVKLLCCNHSRIHYTSLFRKNNLDVNKLEQTGQLQLIILTSTSLNEGSDKALRWSDLSESDLFTQWAHDSKPFALLIDDIDMLELLAPSPLAARRFVAMALSKLNTPQTVTGNHKNNTISVCDQSTGNSCCMQYIVCFGRQPQETVALLSSLGSRGAGNGSGLVTGSAGTGIGAVDAAAAVAPLGEEDAEPALCEYLRYRADVTVTVSALETGYSSAVHGVIATMQRLQHPRRQVLQYKALDSGVLCALVGDDSF